MEEIRNLLESWKNLPIINNVFKKDYFFEGEQVHMMIAVSVEETFLFKTFTAVCNLNMQEIKNAIDKLDEKKEELI